MEAGGEGDGERGEAVDVNRRIGGKGRRKRRRGSGGRVEKGISIVG